MFSTPNGSLGNYSSKRAGQDFGTSRCSTTTLTMAMTRMHHRARLCIVQELFFHKNNKGPIRSTHRPRHTTVFPKEHPQPPRCPPSVHVTRRPHHSPSPVSPPGRWPGSVAVPPPPYLPGGRKCPQRTLAFAPPPAPSERHPRRAPSLSPPSSQNRRFLPLVDPVVEPGQSSRDFRVRLDPVLFSVAIVARPSISSAGILVLSSASILTLLSASILALSFVWSLSVPALCSVEIL
mmetsp:Transcript_15422/g.34608  ORF Transcript_15422/g.34608 Transcript_15422/m.34608 type:complete len:235 (-) Transcript_15422:494-1198(-)